jgi:hypothetical protein
MGRVIGPIVALAVLAALVYGVIVGIRALRARRERRAREQKQRDLATFAPAVLNGSPLVDVVIAQGQQLGNAADLLKALTADQLNVFMPETERQRIRAWLTEHEKGKTQS